MYIHIHTLYTTHTHILESEVKTMKRSEPEIETCAFQRGSMMSDMARRTKQRFRIYHLLDKIQENLKELKNVTNDKK